MKIPNLTVLWPSCVVLILDQLTKMWVRSSLPLGESRSVLGEKLFLLTHVENTGIAFGLKPGSPIFLIIFSILASILLTYLLLTSHKEGVYAQPKIVQLALALILGGAIGNLIDRLLFGRVTDFLDFDFPDFIITRWPAFNGADSAVTIGVTLLCLYLVLSSMKKSDTPPIHRSN